MSEGQQRQENRELGDLGSLVERIRKEQPTLERLLETYRKQRRAYEALRSRRTRMPKPTTTGGREYRV